MTESTRSPLSDPEVDRASPQPSARPVQEVLTEIAALPAGWHRDGSPLPIKVLRAIADRVGTHPLAHSIETGTGKSTLLLSHLSLDHTVFTLCDSPDHSTVCSSPILNRAVVRFIDGPTQRTIPTYRFEAPIDLALLDGPHAFPAPDLEYFHVYPHLRPGAWLLIDDINIPTIHNLFAFLRAEPMFELLDVVGVTAFFRRTSAPVFSPTSDQWWTQAYNARRFPISEFPRWGTLSARIRGFLPEAVRRPLRSILPDSVRKRAAGVMVPEHVFPEQEQ